MNSNKKKVQSGVASSGKAWARIATRFLNNGMGYVEQWADTEAAAVAKCRAYIAAHHKQTK